MARLRDTNHEPLQRDIHPGTTSVHCFPATFSDDIGEGTLQGVVPWRRTAGVAPCEVKASRTVLNGGDEETGSCRPRLVATQLRRSRFRQRLSRSVGPLAIKALPHGR
jgi:hypothetical protein